MRKILCLGLILVLLSSCSNKENLILSNVSICELDSLANENKLTYCIILVESNSSSEVLYRDFLKKNSNITRLSIVNFVDVDLVQNRWLKELFSPISYPLTCVFSRSGELYAILNGCDYESLKYLSKAITERESFQQPNYVNAFGLTSVTLVSVMNQIMKTKMKLDKGGDIQYDINRVVGRLKYPYSLGLKLQNEIIQKQFDKARETGMEILKLKNEYNLVQYPDIFLLAEQNVNPKYNYYTHPRIKVLSDTIISNCKLNKAKYINLVVGNTGEFPLKIFNILTSCSCLSYIGKKNEIVLDKNDKMFLPFVLTPDNVGEITREIFIISDNPYNSLNKITIIGHVTK